MIRQAAQAAASVAATSVGIGRVTPAEYNERIAVCRQCPGNYAIWKTPRGSRVQPKTQEQRQGLLKAHAQVQTCGSILDKNPRTCGCFLHQKAKGRSNRCPNGWWPGDNPATPEETKA